MNEQKLRNRPRKLRKLRNQRTTIRIKVRLRHKENDGRMEINWDKTCMPRFTMDKVIPKLYHQFWKMDMDSAKLMKLDART